MNAAVLRYKLHSLRVLGALSAVAAALVAGPPAKAAETDSARAEFFESKVRPILAASCVKCHGPSTENGGLRLDTREGLLKGGAHGPVVMAGKPSASLLIKAISHADGAPKMPPTGKLPDDQIAALARWVETGAIWPEYSKNSPDAVAGLWSVKPVHKPALPAVKNRAWGRNPIDAFVLARLEAKSMKPAPPAGKRELLRRLTFDLTGLPPTPEEIASFLADNASDAYEKRVDRLLASPRYGERWARYWLDLVRYADSNGYERDAEKPYSWKYRDYVINALNEDKPYDRFVTEQLAGDELPDRSEATIAATGFLRLGTWDDEPNDPVAYKFERLDDLVHAAGTAFLGLTVRCARCHDHKFDPIPQKDYYAFAANFYGGYLDPGDGKLMGGPPPEKLAVPALGFTDAGRTAPPLHLLVNGDPRRESDIVPPGYLTLISAVKRSVQPPPADAITTRRRLQLAAWITDPSNPLTARVIVNRIWQHHFGQGLVRTPNNFGRKGALPTHPELLDWLASTFETPSSNRGFAWRLKPLHRLIVTSSAYRMGSLNPNEAAYARTDFLNENLWRFDRQRLDADALRDAILSVSGELNLKPGGPGFVPTVTREALEGLSRKGAEWTPSQPEDQNRRTVYMFLKRAMLLPMLTVFDFADTTQPLEQRDVTIVAPQALALMNNPFIHQQSEAFARRVESEVGPDPSRQAERVWQLAFGRLPSPQERQEAQSFLTKQLPTKSEIENPKSKIPSSNLGLWLRADRGVQADAMGRVTSWEDQSGHGNSAAQAAAEAQPLLVRDALNGQPALRFDGKKNYLGIPTQVVTSQQFSLFAVVSDRSTDGRHREIFSNWRREDNIGTALFFGATGAASARLSDDFSPVGVLAHKDQAFIVTGIAGPGSVAVYQSRNEIAKKVSPLAPRNLAGPYVIGQQGNINGEFWNGDILELRVYNRALTDEERDQVWDELNQRYGLAPRPKPVSAALVSLCHVLLNANEFIYVD